MQGYYAGVTHVDKQVRCACAARVACIRGVMLVYRYR